MWSGDCGSSSLCSIRIIRGAQLHTIVSLGVTREIQNKRPHVPGPAARFPWIVQAEPWTYYTCKFFQIEFGMPHSSFYGNNKWMYSKFSYECRLPEFILFHIVYMCVCVFGLQYIYQTKQMRIILSRWEYLSTFIYEFEEAEECEELRRWEVLINGDVLSSSDVQTSQGAHSKEGVWRMWTIRNNPFGPPSTIPGNSGIPRTALPVLIGSCSRDYPDFSTKSSACCMVSWFEPSIHRL